VTNVINDRPSRNWTSGIVFEEEIKKLLQALGISYASSVQYWQSSRALYKEPGPVACHRHI
jgi:hypothetical protein